MSSRTFKQTNNSKQGEGLFMKNFPGTVSTVPRARPLTVRRSSSMERAGPPSVEAPGQAFLPPSRRRAPTMPDPVEKKKEKKWSLGGLFRRRKKNAESDSSSAEDEEPPQRKGFLARRRSRRDKRTQRPKIVGTFDHVVVNPLSQVQNRGPDLNGLSASPPQNDFIRDVQVAGRGSRDSLGGSVDRLSNRSSRESIPQHQQHKRQDSSVSRNSSGSGSLEGSTARRGKRDLIKARVEAMRDQHRGSSSDECDGFPASPSLSRFRSDDSLSPSQREGSLNRRSRVARTERYIRRLSRDEESILKREAEMDLRQRLCKSDAEGSFNRTNPKVINGNNKLGVAVNYHELSDNEPRMLTRTPSATPSPAQSPRVRQKPLLQYSSSVPPTDSLTSTFPPSHYHGPTISRSPPQNPAVRLSACPKPYPPRGMSPAPSNRSNESLPVHGLSRSRTEYLPGVRQNMVNYENVYNKNTPNHPYDFHYPGQRSHSYENNIHHAMLNTPSAVPGNDDVLVVQFPIARPQALQSRSVESTMGRGSSASSSFFKPGPPPPPPRDPQRRLTAGPGQPDPPRPMSYAFENGSPQTARIEYSLNHPGKTLDHNGNMKTFTFLPQPHIIANIPATGSAWGSYQRRAGSDNQIACPFPQFQQMQQVRAQLATTRPRPSSVTPEAMRPLPQQQGRLPSRTASDVGRQPENVQPFQYFADQQPRSRKPIHIQYNTGSTADQPYLSDSQVVMMKPPYQDRRNPAITASEFWRQKEQENVLKQRKPSSKPPLQHSNRSDRSRSNSPRPRENTSTENVRGRSSKFRAAPLTFPVRNTESVSSLSGQSDMSSPIQVSKMNSDGSCYDSCDSSGAHGIDSLKKKENPNLRPLSMVLENTESQEQTSSSSLNEETNQTTQTNSKNVPPTPPVRRCSRQSSTSSLEASEWMGDEAENQKNQRRSSNLEDALNELEAIYKSLKLGDEDLLDRAERRDLPTAHQQHKENGVWNNSRGAESDSGFNYGYGSSYDSLFECELPARRQRAPSLRRSGIPDKVMDDMAYRRLNPKERPGSQDIRNVVSQSGSYMLATPALAQSPGAGESSEPQKSPPCVNEEPDITYDDVVYRSIKHANTTLKISDPQPPFGIPLGPITAAPNSDYLHATPVERYRSTFKPRKVPDVVKDDLAFRNLRKDSPKDASGLPITDESGGFVTNPTHSNFSLRKKRAVRSLSANLMSFVHREPLSMAVEEKQQEFEKAQSLSDLPDALQVAQKILEGKEVIGGGPVKLRNLTPGTINSSDAGNASVESNVLDPRYGITPVSWIERAHLDKALGTGASTSTETLTDSRANLQQHDGVNKRSGWQQRLRVYIPPQTDVIQDSGVSCTLDKNEPPACEDEPLSVPDGVPGSPIDEGHLEELLTALAREARATSDRLDLELQQLGEETPNLRIQPDNKQKVVVDNNQNTIFNTNINVNSSDKTACNKDLKPFVVMTSTAVVDSTRENNFHANLKSISEKGPKGVVDMNQTAIVERHFKSVSDKSNKEVRDHNQNITPTSTNCVESNTVEKKSSGAGDNGQKNTMNIPKSNEKESNIRQVCSVANMAEVKVDSNNEKNEHGESVKDDLQKEENGSEKNDDTVGIIKQKITFDASQKTPDEEKDDTPAETVENDVKNEQDDLDQPCTVYRHIQQLTINICNDALESNSADSGSARRESTGTSELNATAPKGGNGTEEVVVKQVVTIATQTGDGECECVEESKTNEDDVASESCEVQTDVATTSSGVRSAGTPCEGSPRRSAECSCCSQHAARGDNCKQQNCVDVPGQCGTSPSYTQLNCLSLAEPVVPLSQPYNATMSDRRLALGPRAAAGDSTSGSSEGGSTAESRMARYKEERRRQLASQFGAREVDAPTQRRYISRTPSGTSVLRSTEGGGSSSNTEQSPGGGVMRVRTTRASRLRAAATSSDAVPASTVKDGTAIFARPRRVPPSSDSVIGRRLATPSTATTGSSDKEKSPMSSDASAAASPRREKDKSSKRKSNLNRSLAAEEVIDLNEDSTVRRRRRRVDQTNGIGLLELNRGLLTTQPEQTVSRATSPRKVTPEPASLRTMPDPAGVLKKSPDSPSRSSPRVSTLDRKISVGRVSPRSAVDSESSKRTNGALETVRKQFTRPNSATETSIRSSLRMTKRTSPVPAGHSVPAKHSSLPPEDKAEEASKKLDVLTSMTRETVARLDQLTTTPHVINSGSKTDTVPKKQPSPPDVCKKTAPIATQEVVLSSSGTASQQSSDTVSRSNTASPVRQQSSILKKKSLEEPSMVVLPPTTHPVSILKRKTSQDEANSSIVPPPVTFSPSVKEHTSSRRGGILKKRASLDESEVLRRRSCSPDMNYTAERENTSDFKPILKRRSSMEELGRRTQSPDPQPHSILKRRTSREDDLDDRATSSPEPQGILKRKSNVSSSSSSNSTSPHVSISASVMMNVAGLEGVDYVSETSEQVRPILKKKSSSEDNATAESSSTDTPRPILKKKSSVEVEERDDRPKKPILKTSRKHSREELMGSSSWDEGMRGSSSRCLKLRSRSVGASDSASGSDCEIVKPILKHSSEDLKSKERSSSPRLHLSFSDNEPVHEKSDSRGSDGSRNTSPIILRRSSKPSQSTGEKVDNELRALLIKRRSLDVDSRSVESDSAVHLRRSKSPLSDRGSSPRPMSVAERIMTMENFLEQESVRGSTGAVPKRLNIMRASRNSERFHTQPITQEELLASARLQSKDFLEVVEKPALVNGVGDHKPEEKGADDQKFNTVESKRRGSSPLNEDSDISYRTPPTSPTREAVSRGSISIEKSSLEPSPPPVNKMEGTAEPEVEDFRGLCKSNSVSARASMFAQLEEEMKIAARESVSRRSFKGSSSGGSRYRERKEESSRFATQPVTQDELEEAVRQNQRKELDASVSTQGLVGQSDESKDEDDPSKLSLAERVRLFNQKIMEERLPKTVETVPAPVVRKRLASRFKTQPITTEEVETAVQKISPLAATLVKPPDPELLGNISVRAAREKMFEHSAQLLSKSGSAPRLVRVNSKDSPSPKTAGGDSEVRPKGILKHTRESDSRRTSSLDAEKEVETESESEVKGILKTGGGGSGTQTPELESFRHLKSVLKKETNTVESHSENSEVISATNEQLRSILKPESTEWASQEDDSSLSDGDSSSSESSECDQPPSNPHISSNLRSNLRGGSGIDMVSILLDVEAHALKKRQAQTSSPNNKQKLGEEKLKNMKNLSQEKENQKDAYVKKKLDDYLSSSKKSIDVRETKVLSSKTVEKTSGNQNKTESKQVTGELRKTKKVVENHDLTYQKKIRKQLEELQHLSSAAETTPPTSDGDTSSSGGREVRRIISNDAVARRRQAAINKQLREKAHLTGQPLPPHLLKSRSQSSVPACGASDGQDEDSLRIGLHGLQRSSTQPLGKELEAADTMSGASIRDRMAALQKSGSTDWKKRLSRLNPEDDLSLLVTNNKLNEIHSRPRPQLSPPKHGPEEPEDDLDNCLSPGSILADRLGKLDAATQGWKKRVGPTDAVKFSVAGRMLLEQKTDVTLTTLLSNNDANSTTSPMTSPLPAQLKSISSDRQKRTPRAARFRGKTAELRDASSTPVSPQKELTISFKRSISAPGGDEENGFSASDQQDELLTPKVTIPRADDETFREFYRSVTTDKLLNERLEIHDEDLDKVVSQSNQLLVQKRTVRVQRRNTSSRNPVKALAARKDLQEEYIEVRTGFAEKELKRIKVEKLAKNSSLAVEALAGLASKEDFTAVALKKASPSSSAMLPYKDLMLLHIKGRRHVQTRLVEPIASSINDGDNYVLVTPSEVYNWVGRYSNVIERSRGAEVAQHIHQRKDLGCNGANQVITISNEKVTCSASHVQRFWSLLGAGPDSELAATAVKAGHPDEDELYETSMIATNMVFEVQNDELVPIEDSWGNIPRISILDPAKILVFDFGSELYVWNGKNASLDARRSAQRLARELWEEGYNYSECDVCPLNIAASLGGRNNSDQLPQKGETRPSWALLAKVNQHMETILFREKFLDWPDFSRVIRSKSLEDSEKQADASMDIKPCDAKAMLEPNTSEPDLELEGAHLGRGLNYFDPETHRHSEISTLGVTVWHILEYEHTQLPKASVGQFHAGDSYVVRWQYSITVTGRELGSGQPSRHSMVGRDRCAYFCWQGEASPLNEQGAAALLTVELDHERGPQVRVVQGAEPPAFLNLFSGGMVVHSGRREPDEEELEEETSKGPWRLYISRGVTERETVLVQVPCSMRQLRSRACLVLINTATGAVHLWYGSKATKNTQQITRKAVEQLKEKRPAEFCFKSGVGIVINEHQEGSEKKEFFQGIGGDSRQLYMSLVNKKHSYTHTPRLFHLTSVSGVFTATEFLGPYRYSAETVAYPFLQADLYSASQPALFLLDNHDELWLWQGWWPENGDDGSGDNSNQTGSGAVRWQAERRAAMQTALDYWRLGHPGQKATSLKAYLVWAGLEPLRFTNLFPMWTDRDDIAEINIRDGKKPGEVLTVEVELARLTRSTYPPAQLLQRPLPDGVDPTRLELYLDPSHFQELLGMSKEEFMELPVWKQKEVKKDVGLF